MLRVWGNQGDLRSQDRVLQTRVTQGKKQRELQRFPLKYSAKYPSRRACEETTEAGEESPKRIQGSSTSAQKGLEIEFLLPSVKLANFTVHWTLRKILRKAGPQPWDQAALTLLTVLLHLIHLRSQIWKKHTVSSNLTQNKAQEYFIGTQKYAEPNKLKSTASAIQRSSGLQRSRKIQPIMRKKINPLKPTQNTNTKTNRWEH